MTSNTPLETAYRRAMLHKAAELAQKHGGLKRIPAETLLENGIDIVASGRTLTVSVSFPDPHVMERRIAGKLKPPKIAREIERFKLPPEPVPRTLIQKTATMEDFWIEQGWYKIDRNGWRLTLAKWAGNDELKRKATRFLAEVVLKKDPRDLAAPDFKANMLKGLLTGQYSNSPYAAVTDAYPGLEIMPWEMASAPNKIYREKKNRIAAIRWAVEKTGKEPREMTQEDLSLVRGVLPYYKGSPYEAISDAYPELEIMPWEMATTPKGFFRRKRNRVKAVKWLAKKLEKNPRDLAYDDFGANGLFNLMNDYYGSSPYKAVREAFPDIEPWEMSTKPRGFFEQKNNRVAAVMWLVEKLGKEPRDIVGTDFESNRLWGLFTDYYGSSTYEALLEAGLVTTDDEQYMRKSGPRKKS